MIHQLLHLLEQEDTISVSHRARFDHYQARRLKLESDVEICRQVDRSYRAYFDGEWLRYPDPQTDLIEEWKCAPGTSFNF